MAHVERSSYYYWQMHKDDRAFKDKEALNLIKSVHDKSKAKAGIRVICMKIQRNYGIKINVKKIARIKKEYSLLTQIRRKKRVNFYKFNQHEHRFKKNILNRQFSPKKADQVYSTDITEMRFNGSRKIYMSAVKDLCTKEVVAYTTSLHLGMSLSVDVAVESLRRLSSRKSKKLIIHSDQGVHYTSGQYRSVLAQFNVQQSMSRRGNCLDNAPIESFFGHMKDELDLSECADYQCAKDTVKKYINYYNNNRPQWGLKAKTPVEYRGFIEGSPFINLS